MGQQPVELLERAPVVPEPNRQPVEELGVRWLSTHAPEVVRRVDEAAAEVVLPHAVDDRPPGQRVVPVGDPPRERRAPLSFARVGIELEVVGQIRQERQRPRLGQRAALPDVPALEQVDRPRPVPLLCRFWLVFRPSFSIRVGSFRFLLQLG